VGTADGGGGAGGGDPEDPEKRKADYEAWLAGLAPDEQARMKDVFRGQVPSQAAQDAAAKSDSTDHKWRNLKTGETASEEAKRVIGIGPHGELPEKPEKAKKEAAKKAAAPKKSGGSTAKKAPAKPTKVMQEDEAPVKSPAGAKLTDFGKDGVARYEDGTSFDGKTWRDAKGNEIKAPKGPSTQDLEKKQAAADAATAEKQRIEATRQAAQTEAVGELLKRIGWKPEAATTEGETLAVRREHALARLSRSGGSLG
jgi:hypothetical protein